MDDITLNLDTNDLCVTHCHSGDARTQHLTLSGTLSDCDSRGIVSAESRPTE